jgi:hypothetical protein
MRQIWGRVARPDPRFVIEDHEPVYLQTWRNGLLNGKVATALRELEECRVCPRNCRINRLKDERRVLPEGSQRQRHDFLWSLQSALRVLPELGHQPAGNRPRAAT